MINNIMNNNFFSISNNNLFSTKKEKETTDPIFKAIEEMLMRKTITEKEIKGEKLTDKEQEFKNNNIVILDPEVLLLNMLKSKDVNEHNSKLGSYEDKESKDFKNNNSDILKLKEILNNNIF